MTQSKNPAEMRAYMVGGGIASLASAAFLVRDGKMPGNNITILEESSLLGGALDGIGDPEKGYVIRGGREMNFSYLLMYELFSTIPSLTDPKKSVTDEMKAFNEAHKTSAKARLVDRNRNKVDANLYGLSDKDRNDLFALLTVVTEEECGVKRIDEYFEPHFFTTNWWFMYSTMLSFQPWHSLVEVRRYLIRFSHDAPNLATVSGVDRSPYNQYDSFVLPIVKWLKEQGVHFELGVCVTDVDFAFCGNEKTATRIHLTRGGKPGEIKLSSNDLVFVTNGSMTECSSLGTMNSAPVLKGKRDGGVWSLWENIAKKSRAFGNPYTFANRIDESKWESFTVTCKDPKFFELMEKFSGNEAGTGALVTLKDSSWVMSIVLAHQPHFINQPANVQVFWGYSLFGDRIGDCVKKKMSECTGEEILTELLHHLGFEADKKVILETSNCIPCMMPFITSQFLTRAKGDRPEVIPSGAVNFAFIGQYAELPDDIVFTVEYSIRTARVAAYKLLGLDREIPGIYRAKDSLRVAKETLDCMFA